MNDIPRNHFILWKYFLHFIYFHHIFTAKYRWKFTHNILEAKIKHETSKVNNRTVSSMLRKIPRPWRHKGIYIYIYTFQFNEYSFGEFRTLERLIRMTSSCIFHSIYSISKNKRSRSRNSLLCYKIGTSVLRWQGRLTNNLCEIYIYIMFSFQFFKRNYKNKVIDELY